MIAVFIMAATLVAVIVLMDQRDRMRRPDWTTVNMRVGGSDGIDYAALADEIRRDRPLYGDVHITP